MSHDKQIPEGVAVRISPEAYNNLDGRRPLVLLNGIGAGAENWGNFVEALARPVVAIDVSQAQSCEYKPSMGDYSRALMGAVDTLGYERFDLLGVSWGGALAQETAKHNSSRIGKLVLAATLPGRFSVPPKIAAARALGSSDRSSVRFLQQAGQVYGGDIRSRPDLLSKIGVERQTNEAAYNRQRRAILLWNNSLLSLLRIPNPTLVMAGADDPITRPINSRLMNRALRDSEIVIVPEEDGGGHLFLHTRPVESAAVINKFLDAPARHYIC